MRITPSCLVRKSSLGKRSDCRFHGPICWRQSRSPHMSLGHRPKEFDSNDNEALKAGFKAKNRAFSASLVGSIKSWDVAPGW